MKFVDLSIPIIDYDEAIYDPAPYALHIEYKDHKRGALEMGILYPRLKPEKHLIDGSGWATETITLSTHNGTHMDAPWHYAPTQDKEKGIRKAMTIDEFPLEWGMGPLVVLDVTDLEDGFVMQPKDVDRKLEDIDYKLKEGDILCIHTTAPKFAGTNEYLQHGVGVGKEATLHVVRQGVNVVGTDAWTWDAPFTYTSKRWKASLKAREPNPSIIWEGHFAGRELGYFQMEKLWNLDKVPPVGATIYCFPIKIARAGAGWVRAVATIPE